MRRVYISLTSFPVCFSLSLIYFSEHSMCGLNDWQSRPRLFVAFLLPMYCLHACATGQSMVREGLRYAETADWYSWRAQTRMAIMSQAPRRLFYMHIPLTRSACQVRPLYLTWRKIYVGGPTQWWHKGWWVVYWTARTDLPYVNEARTQLEAPCIAYNEKTGLVLWHDRLAWL